ncbi:MAG: hypothetical protein ACPGVG_15195, partial [Mycobacterium sp.]
FFGLASLHRHNLAGPRCTCDLATAFQRCISGRNSARSAMGPCRRRAVVHPSQYAALGELVAFSQPSVEQVPALA